MKAESPTLKIAANDRIDIITHYNDLEELCPGKSKYIGRRVECFVSALVLLCS